MKKIICAVLLTLGTWHATAAEKIRVIIPFQASGATSILAQTWTKQLNSLLKSDNVELILEYAPGAGGKIATSKLLNSNPKNLTLMFTSNQLLINNRLDNKEWTMHKDIVPMAYGGTTPMIIITSTRSQIKTFRDLLINKDHKKISFGHSGEGSGNWLAVMSLQRLITADFNLVGYKGNAPALQDLMGGHLDAMIDFYSTALPHIQSGAVNPVATLWDQPLKELDNTPNWMALTQQTFPTATWWGFFANNTVDQKTSLLIKNAMHRSSRDKKFVEQLGLQGYWLKPMDFDTFVNQQINQIRQLDLVVRQ